jgi:hypothetical protein
MLAAPLAVAEKVTGDPIAPSTRAVTVCVPSAAPSVKKTDERPSWFVGAVV